MENLLRPGVGKCLNMSMKGLYIYTYIYICIDTCMYMCMSIHIPVPGHVILTSPLERGSVLVRGYCTARRYRAILISNLLISVLRLINGSITGL